MACFLFDDIVFGPVKSRRFGVSLGVNLLPLDMKFCTFNCVYCECGLTHPAQDKKAKLNNTESIIHSLDSRFRELKNNGLKPDNITFAGNGEPTLHPGFPTIIDNTIRLRDEIFPQAEITVLSNATRLHIPAVRDALLKIDNNVLKLDAGTQETFELINRPASPVKLADIVSRLASFGGRVVIQTLFLRGVINGVSIDNTLESEIGPWLGYLEKIKPSRVMIYPIDRSTPEQGIEKISQAELLGIARRLEPLAIPYEVF
ncbi:Wyosine [tRNA(Phe)-imidazoG37] synthetase, radical SAM superfamily [Lentimicrobium saccharophilum]|uniref:Wyosine [tRNA(Phe)-imidazoG37] synthetase, radical SAM superfamily n=1 Tax=Lentimicrobium saccharophilum TaxID=1678841 RepID=A0A0S7C024_9BACT|nr:radical SAM protein [Lentimicrobium saccharophilum]GAP43858.1 Wyosine [tRNA(Phe)-imidazoG37] synthetase, radical SAM superfamily [Lentimicrobium saccharophilum]